MKLERITAFRLVTEDIDRLARFYEAIGFRRGERGPISPEEMRLLGLKGLGERLALRLGEQRVELDAFENAGRPYPAGTDAAALVFQHLALVAHDAGAAWACARSAGAERISLDGPVRLPPSNGRVTAIKFRDLDGHPLEILQFPGGDSRGFEGEGLLGIDHSAISVSNVAVSRAFYVARGLSEGEVTINSGPAQETLDGLQGVKVEVIPMHPAHRPPHLELLGYRSPRPQPAPPRAANDVAATRVVWSADRTSVFVDPDRHLHQTTVC